LHQDKFNPGNYLLKLAPCKPDGGHFAALEQPGVLANDIFEFAKELNL
jgi:hypothetical protein